MQLVESPNRWSCVPCSFAMVLGLSYPQIIQHLGHDGSAIIWPDLPEPQRRRTFHIQECIAVSWRLGWAVTEHQFEPVITPDGRREYSLARQHEIESNIMRQVSGVLLGRGRSNMHAVAWDHNTQKIYDPAGMCYGFQNQTMFQPMTFFGCCDIKSKPI